MKYELQTIPVWDAYEQSADCPLCTLEGRLEADYQRFFLGNAVMAPEIRVEVNATGFCRHHFTLLDGGGNRLGLSLMTRTHLEERHRRFRANRSAVEKAAAAGRGRRARAGLGALREALAQAEDGCMICTRLERDIANYAFTILRLHETNDEFAHTFRASQGFCLPHLRTVLAVTEDVLSGASLTAWLSDLFAVQDTSLGGLDAALEDMASRYDYRSTEPPTEETKAAVPRAIAKLVGRFR